MGFYSLVNIPSYFAQVKCYGGIVPTSRLLCWLQAELWDWGQHICCGPVVCSPRSNGKSCSAAPIVCQWNCCTPNADDIEHVNLIYT